MKTKWVILFIILLTTFFLSEKSHSQWLPTNGPIGGRANSIVINGNYLICGTASGVFYSTDNGGSWRFSQDFYKIVYSVLAKGNHLFAGTDTYGIFRSSNNGISWNPTSMNVRNVVSLATNGNDIFAGCYTFIPSGTSGVWKSTNDGVNWAHIGLDNDNIFSLLSHESILLAGTGSRGIFLTTNYGLNWVQTSISSGTVNTIINKDYFLFAGTTGGGVYISSNNGYNWVQTSLNNKNVYSLLVRQGIIYAGTDSSGIFISTNNGTTWNNLNSYSYGAVLSMAQRDSLLFVGTMDNGVYLNSNNSNFWLQTPLPNRNISSLTTNGTKIFAGTYGAGLYSSSNNGFSWEHIPLALHITALLAWDNYVFAGVVDQCCGSPSKLIMRSSDGGLNWTQIFPYDMRVGALAYVGGSLLAGVSPYLHYDCGVYRSTDMGNTWSGPALDSMVINCLITEGNSVFAGTDQGVFLSTDEGITWQSLKLTDKSILSLAVKDNYIFAGTFSSGLYISSNFGQTWVQSSINNTRVPSVITIGDIVVVSADYAGVYISTNFGQTWLLKNQGLDCKIIPALVKDNNYIYAGTSSNSVWKRTLNDIISVKNISSIIPDKFRIYQNYPNPFNAETDIRFDLKEPGYVKILIFDVLGRVVASLVEQRLNSGSYVIHWTANNISSGIYYYRLSVNKSQSETKKMIFIK